MRTSKWNVTALDPRAGLILLMAANVIVFAQKTTMPGNVFVLLLAVIMTFSGHVKSAAKFCLLFLTFVLAQKYVFSVAPMWVNFMFGIFCNYGRRMLPCFMAGVLLIQTNSLHRFVLAMRKLHFPQSIIIPIAVSVRYFPAIKEEFIYIGEAMKLRGTPWMRRMEGYLVPIMLSATTTAQELAQAAVTRGIENPCPKTSAEELKCEWTDWIWSAVGVIMAVLTIFIDIRG